MENLSSSRTQGVSLRKLNVFMAIVTLLVSALLIVVIYRTSGGFQTMRGVTEEYIGWRQNIADIQRSSNYLTDQARFFALTGDASYVQSYFLECSVSGRRDEALDAMRDRLEDASARAALADALAHSLLMEEMEFYSMRLRAAADTGEEQPDFPEALLAVELAEEDAALSSAEQLELAQELVLDKQYLQAKEDLFESLQECLAALVAETQGQQELAASELQSALERERLLSFALIATVLSVLLLTMLLAIQPLIRSVRHVRSEQPIPVKGSSEFRFLAKTFNTMFEETRQKGEKLAYEASHDPLTGLYNRAGYDYLLSTVDLETSTLLLIDADNFKTVNDTYGHDMGDRVLVRIASVFHESFRSGDYICRIGGDEFAAIMVRSGPQFKELIREKIARINDLLLHPEDDLPPVSVSVGAAFGGNKHGSGSMVKDADTALYQMKEAGRCGVMFFE